VLTNFKELLAVPAGSLDRGSRNWIFERLSRRRLRRAAISACAACRRTNQLGRFACSATVQSSRSGVFSFVVDSKY